MKPLQANLSILRERFPAVYDQVRDVLKHSSARNSIKIGSNGFALEHRHTWVHPYGTINPQALVQRWLHGIDLKPDTLYGLTGFGNGSHVEALLNSSPTSASFIIAEPSTTILAHVLQQSDCTAILGNPRIFLATGPCDQNFFKILGDISLGAFKNLHPLIYAPLFSLDETYYNAFLVGLAHNFDAYLHNYLSAIRSSGFHQEQCMRNLPQLFNAPDIGKTKGLFKGHSLVLVGAGPSLDESIDFLKKAQQHAIIVSVNSSHRKLINSGIKPAVTVAADPRIFTHRGYEGVDTSDTFLFCPFFVSPPVIEKFKGRIFTWAISQHLINVLRKRAQQPPPTPVTELGTISSCVVDIARQWGCAKICLVGQDFAIRADGVMHTEDSFYSDMRQNVMDTHTCRKLPGTTLKEVFVDDKLFVYLKTFEQLVEDYSSLEFINTARLGAAVKGIPYRGFDAALTWLKTGHSPNVSQQLRNILDQHRKVDQVEPEKRSQLIEPSLTFAEKLLNLALEAALFQQTLPATYDSKRFKKSAHVRRALSYADKVNQLIDHHPDDYAILFDGEAKKHLTEFVECKKQIQGKTAHWQAICENREYFWALAESARFMLSRLKILKQHFADQAVMSRHSIPH